MAGTPLTSAERRLLLRLHRRRGRQDAGLFLAEGVRVVEELVSSRLAIELAVVASSFEDSGGRARELAAALRERAPVRVVADHELARVAATDAPQGVVAAAAVPSVELATLAVRARELVLVLDGVQDPGNFGTLVRSADAFGAGGVVLLPGTVDAWNAKAVRAAAGASFRQPLVAASEDALFEWLAEHGFEVLVAAADGTPVEAVRRRARVALLVGNEGAGVAGSVARRAHGAVSVPIAAHAESLNVGVAAGILLYHLTRSGD